MTESFQTLEVRPLSGALGAEISGVDLAKDIPDRQFMELRQTYDSYGVIFFRDQVLTPEQHTAFARRWGEININRFFQPLEGYPAIAEVCKEPENTEIIGSRWHTDHSYDEVPAMGSILYAKEVPEVGGDTLFASMYEAYDALSDGMKDMLEELRAVHSSRHVFGAASYAAENDFQGRIGNSDLATQDAVHPVALTHPRTGRKALYVNPNFTVRFDGWTEAESKPLLDYLYQHAQRPEFVCRFRWRKGSVAFWDNLCTWHRAVNDYPGQRRLMHRITLDGVPIQQPGR